MTLIEHAMTAVCMADTTDTSVDCGWFTPRVHKSRQHFLNCWLGCWGRFRHQPFGTRSSLLGVAALGHTRSTEDAQCCSATLSTAQICNNAHPMGDYCLGRCCSGRIRLAESIIELQIMRAPGPRSAGHTGASAWDHPRTPLSHHPTIAFFALRLRQRYSTRRTAEPHSCAWGNVAVREVLLRRDYCWLKTISKPLRFVVRHGRKFLNGGFRSPHYSVELLKATEDAGVSFVWLSLQHCWAACMHATETQVSP